MINKTYTGIWVFFFALMACSGQEVDLNQVGEMFRMEKPVIIEPVEFETLLPSISQAFVTAETAKTGDLKSLPFVNVDVNSEIAVDKKPDAAAFKIESLLITDYDTGPDGTISLGFLSESGDVFGRKDRRIGKIVYRTKKPNTAQAQDIQAWLLNQGGYLFAEANNTTREALIDFQKNNGLSPDGQFGSKSAEVLAQDLSMINVKELQNHIFYPETPNHMVFILPYEVFKREELKLSQGFQSLLEVGKLGLTPDKFKNMAKPGQQYVLFIYFFDRIDPTLAIIVGFSATAKRWHSGSMSQKYYAKPDSWPVIAETFTIDGKLADQLFVNVFFKSTFRYQCVGSHKLL